MTEVPSKTQVTKNWTEGISVIFYIFPSDLTTDLNERRILIILKT